MSQTSNSTIAKRDALLALQHAYVGVTSSVPADEAVFVSCAVPEPPPRPRKPRKPSIASQIRRAEKSGKQVTSVTTPDGTTLRFDEPAPAETNPWLAEIKKATRQ